MSTIQDTLGNGKAGKIWKASWEIHKYMEGESKPYEISKFGQNVALDTGKAEILDLILGTSVNHFDATTQIGVGDAATAEASSQTDLLAVTNKAYSTVSSAPTKVTTTTTNDTLSAVASFGAGVAEYDWNEFVIRQGTSTICLNRKAATQGTKGTGQTWTVVLKLQLLS